MFINQKKHVLLHYTIVSDEFNFKVNFKYCLSFFNKMIFLIDFHD